MKRLALLVTAVVLLAAAPADAKKPTYYLALGDSLAWGYQQDATGSIVKSPKGYVDQVYAAAKKKTKGLKLVNYGCPAENLATWTQGGCAGQPLVSAIDRRPQFTKAKAFLKKLRKRTKLITVSLGANEFTPCAVAGSVDIPCIGLGIERLQAELPATFKALRKVAGKKVRIVTHDLFNPYLALALKGGDYATLALGSKQFQTTINETIRSAAKQANIKVANVAKAFDAADPVQRICQLTQNCLPAPQGNIHPNDAGYTVIANAIRKLLPRG